MFFFSTLTMMTTIILINDFIFFLCVRWLSDIWNSFLFCWLSTANKQREASEKKSNFKFGCYAIVCSTESKIFPNYLCVYVRGFLFCLFGTFSLVNLFSFFFKKPIFVGGVFSIRRQPHRKYFMKFVIFLIHQINRIGFSIKVFSRFLFFQCQSYATTLIELHFDDRQKKFFFDSIFFLIHSNKNYYFFGNKLSFKLNI